ncbi:MAG: hypothetical protein AAGH99_09420 [Planctomycetota bacterium]
MRNLLSILWVALLICVPAAAFGQPVAEAKPVPGWLAFMVMVGLLIVIAIASFMSSRRGHQD